MFCIWAVRGSSGRRRALVGAWISSVVSGIGGMPTRTTVQLAVRLLLGQPLGDLAIGMLGGVLRAERLCLFARHALNSTVGSARGRRAITLRLERRLDLRDRLVVVAEVDDVDAELARGGAVHLDVVDEQALGELEVAERVRIVVTEALERKRVDLGLGLPHADEGRVDDQLEDLVDRQHRAPEGLPLAHVVGQQRHPHPAGLGRPHLGDHRLVRLERLEVDLLEPVHLRLVAQLHGELGPQRGQELVLGQVTLLELVERMLAVALVDPLHRARRALRR